MTATDDLLQACSFIDDGPRVRARVEQAVTRPGIAWREAQRLSLRHGLAPVVGYHLSRIDVRKGIPHDAVAYFNEALPASRRRNGVLFAFASRIATALDEAGIPHLFLKGCCLAPTVYPDAGLRSLADIDVLVKREDMSRATAAVRTCGFETAEREIPPVYAHQEFGCYCAEDILTGIVPVGFDAAHTAEGIAERGHRVSLEIHRGLFRLPSGALRDVDMRAFWDRPRSTRLPSGGSLKTPSPEAALVHLAAHGACDNFRRLVFLVDATQILKAHCSRMDWDHVLAMAEQYRVGSDLYRLLDCAAAFYGAPMPPEALARARRTHPRSRRLSPHDIVGTMNAGDLAMTWTRWIRTESVSDRVVSAWHIVFPQAPTMRRFYGVRTTPALIGAYVWRPFQLIGRLVRVLSTHSAVTLYRYCSRQRRADAITQGGHQ